jgi:hypothetical protein
MNETSVGEVLTGDCMSFEFPRHYQLKAFLRDASRLRDLARTRSREALTEDEQGEVLELRKRLRRADGDSILLLIAQTRRDQRPSLLLTHGAAPDAFQLRLSLPSRHSYAAAAARGAGIGDLFSNGTTHRNAGVGSPPTSPVLAPHPRGFVCGAASSDTVPLTFGHVANPGSAAP